MRYTNLSSTDPRHDADTDEDSDGNEGEGDNDATGDDYGEAKGLLNKLLSRMRKHRLQVVRRLIVITQMEHSLLVMLDETGQTAKPGHQIV